MGRGENLNFLTSFEANKGVSTWEGKGGGFCGRSWLNRISQGIHKIPSQWLM